jgi:hypothetical protein
MRLSCCTHYTTATTTITAGVPESISKDTGTQLYSLITVLILHIFKPIFLPVVLVCFSGGGGRRERKVVYTPDFGVCVCECSFPRER